MSIIAKVIWFIVLLLLVASLIVVYKKKTTMFNACRDNKNDRSINSTKDTMITTPTGLQYEVLQEAAVDARAPKTGDHVTVHYTGWLQENGKKGRKFDSSVDRGEPFNFIVGIGQVIPGWDEGVLSMKIGEKRTFVIPYQLAYGEHGYPGAIPPKATLLFDVELLDIA